MSDHSRTTLQARADALADVLIRFANADSRRGVVADALVNVRLHAQPIVLVELAEALARRAAQIDDGPPSEPERADVLAQQLALTVADSHATERGRRA